jgi:hypothetical protein
LHSFPIDFKNAPLPDKRRQGWALKESKTCFPLRRIRLPYLLPLRKNQPHNIGAAVLAAVDGYQMQGITAR